MAYKMTLHGSSAIIKTSAMVTSATYIKYDREVTTLTPFSILRSAIAYGYVGPDPVYNSRQTFTIEIPQVARLTVTNKMVIPPNSFHQLLTTSLWLAKSIPKTFLAGQNQSDIGRMLLKFDPDNGVTKFDQTEANTSTDPNAPNGAGELTVGVDLCSDLLIRVSVPVDATVSSGINVADALAATFSGSGSAHAAIKMTIAQV